MNGPSPLDAGHLLARVAGHIPESLRGNVVVIGSIATAWAFRDVSGTHAVATKDIDLLLRPAVDAIATAETLGEDLLDLGWRPHYPNGLLPGDADTPEDRLPALRLRPPDEADGWFVELLAEPAAGQATRKHWRRFHTPLGDFGLPSFRYMRVAVHGADTTEFGLRVARPANMALAHLLEHAEPDRTPISNLPGNPPRFVKDTGRALALWWLAQEQSPLAAERWQGEWRQALDTVPAGDRPALWRAASDGLAHIRHALREAHAVARLGVLAPHGTTLEAFARAHASLQALLARAEQADAAQARSQADAGPNGGHANGYDPPPTDPAAPR